MNEKTNLKESFEKTFNQLISLVSSFDDAQWNRVPFEDSWTPGQVTAHIIKATDGIPDSTTAAATRPYDENVQQIEDVFLDFDSKLKSPDFILPGDGPFSKKDQLHHLHRILAAHLVTIAAKDLHALCLDAEIPVWGLLTRFEWLKFILVHTQRHIWQLGKIANVIDKKKAGSTFFHSGEDTA